MLFGMTSHETASTTPTRIIRRAAVLDRVGLSYSTIWRMYRAGRFPSPIRISLGAVGWIEADIEQWITSRAEAGR